MNAPDTKGNVLLIEDEWGFRRIFGDVLKLRGLTYLEANDGETGLEIARKQKPDLIILDLVLPKISGFDVLQRIRADKRTRHIPVMMLTVIGDKGEIEDCLQAGATEYVIKGSMPPGKIADMAAAAVAEKKRRPL